MASPRCEAVTMYGLVVDPHRLRRHRVHGSLHHLKRHSDIQQRAQEHVTTCPRRGVDPDSLHESTPARRATRAAKTPAP